MTENIYIEIIKNNKIIRVVEHRYQTQMVKGNRGCNQNEKSIYLI